MQQHVSEIGMQSFDGLIQTGGLFCAALRERAASAAVAVQRRVDRRDQKPRIRLDPAVRAA